MARLLNEFKCKSWTDDVHWNGNSPGERFATLDEILTRIESFGLVVAAHKCDFSALEVSLRENIFSAGQASHDSARIHGLATMRRSRIAGHLMQFLHAANWMWTAPQRMSHVVEPLRATLEEGMDGTPRRTA